MLRIICIKPISPTTINHIRIGYVENNLYKKQDSITFNNTHNIYNHIHQYSTDVFNNYKIKTHNVNKT